jgi:hypothetical protein
MRSRPPHASFGRSATQGTSPSGQRPGPGGPNHRRCLLDRLQVAAFCHGRVSRVAGCNKPCTWTSPSPGRLLRVLGSHPKLAAPNTYVTLYISMNICLGRVHSGADLRGPFRPHASPYRRAAARWRALGGGLGLPPRSLPARGFPAPSDTSQSGIRSSPRRRSATSILLAPTTVP